MDTPPSGSPVPGPAAKNIPVRQIGAPPAPRTYPKPPPILTRVFFLCFKPESWAETARYPLHVTLIPLLLVILLSAVAMAAFDASRMMRSLQSFAAGYDKAYPPLRIDSKGVVSAEGDLPAPIRFDLEVPHARRLPVWIDPTGKTAVESLKPPRVLISDQKIFLVKDPDHPLIFSIPDLARGLNIVLPPRDAYKPIDGTSLARFVEKLAPLVVLMGMGWAVILMIVDLLWSALMMFLFSPLVTIAAAGPRPETGPDRRLLLPRRAAIRMVAGSLVPLVAANAILHVLGHPVEAVLRDFTLLFWFLVVAGMAVWTGLVARKMYGQAAQKN
jgi:hypothetical protein